MLKSIFFCTLFLLSFVLKAQVWVYPSPGEPIQISPFFNVKINQEGQQFSSYVNYWQATSGDLKRSNSWTTFSFNNKITVEVEVLEVNVQECIIRPKSDSIQFEIVGNIIRFELLEPKKLAIEINGSKENVLFLFADPAEENIPANNEKGLWNYSAGVHNIGIVQVPDSVKHIYIAGGAWVNGAFVNKNRASGFKITGRGVLSSTELENLPQLIDLQGKGLNAFVEGITMCNNNAGGVGIAQNYSTIRNCKFLGWNEKSDGVVCGEHALIEDCFFRCGGDALKVYNNFLIAQNCVFWQNETGSSFQLGWNLNDDVHNFRVSDCDIICCERQVDSNNAAIFSSVHGGTGNLSNYLFENIRIEDDVYRLFKLTIRTNLFVTEPGYGSISNIHFKNISLEGKALMANEIWGYNQKHTINNVVFDDLFIDGKKIANEKDGNFKINLNTATGVVFK